MRKRLLAALLCLWMLLPMTARGEVELVPQLGAGGKPGADSGHGQRGAGRVAAL